MTKVAGKQCNLMPKNEEEACTTGEPMFQNLNTFEGLTIHAFLQRPTTSM